MPDDISRLIKLKPEPKVVRVPFLLDAATIGQLDAIAAQRGLTCARVARDLICNELDAIKRAAAHR